LIKLTMDPWFVTGFADAEGCFSISLVRKNKLKVGWEVKIRFQINLLLRTKRSSFIGTDSKLFWGR
jgi:hypothetical protein